MTGHFKNLKTTINVEYLRPHRERSENVWPPPAHLSVKPLAADPAGEWFQIAYILHHRGKAGPRQQCLVRWEGFDASHDSWIRRDAITPKALIAYEKFLRAAADDSPAYQPILDSFITIGGKYSEIKPHRMSAGAANPQRVSAGAENPQQTIGCKSGSIIFKCCFQSVTRSECRRSSRNTSSIRKNPDEKLTFGGRASHCALIYEESSLFGCGRPLHRAWSRL